MNRRGIFGLGTVAAAATVLGSRSLASAAPATETDAGDPVTRIKRVYQRQSAIAGGTWSSYISLAADDGTLTPVVEDKADDVVEAYSVNKIAVATAVLDKVDRGLLTMEQRVDVTADIIIADGDGIFRLDGGYPSSITIGHAMAMLLTVSDDTAVRLCGLVCPAKELNEILVAKGFPKTQVVPVANPNRFYLGTTTPREMHNLLQGLIKGELLSKASTDYLFNILRSPTAFTDGIRLNMSTNERLRVATKAGWQNDGRNEAGIMFDTAGKPALTYSLFASKLSDVENFAATHPAIKARAVMGRVFFDNMGTPTGPTVRSAAKPFPYRPSNGG